MSAASSARGSKCHHSGVAPLGLTSMKEGSTGTKLGR
jgi:hypothetical protein